ncbi:cell wall-binding repeat-containing protein [Pseudalkalibacillus hwajinpoensis]|uniref:cell wall-binding repeat-containing protein n=1 Tax=Guptibacillus hwajinpoensis TaxID=208199 RepID=UPI00325A53ED
MIEVPATEVDETIDRLQTNKEVEHVEEDQPVYLMNAQPDDPLFSYQKAWVEQIDLSGAWDLVRENDTSSVVAVIDSGVDLNHPDLKANITEGVNLITPAKLPQDVDGHGTRVAGLIGAETNNKIGIASPSRGVMIMPVKVTENGTGKLSTVVEGIRYAIDHGADAINLSLGSYNHSFALRTIIDEAIANNILVVGAAGNDNDSAVVYPAAYPEVLSVAAVETGTTEKASFSNYGSLVDIAAPGTDIYSTSLNGTYAFDDGTSVAAPIAMSSAVLLKKHAPYLTNKQTFKLMKSTAEELSGSYLLGSGLLNVESAVNEVSEYKRVYGDTAIQTAIEISRNSWRTLKNQTLEIDGQSLEGKFIVLARSDEFPDSLAASPLASKLESPILLTKRNELSADVMGEIERLSPDHVLIIGGENAIPEKVLNGIESVGINTTRIAGDNRYDTATEIAQIVDGDTNQTFIVSGEKFPDALSISSFAARLEAPVVFTKDHVLPEESITYLKQDVKETAYVIGGEEVVDANVFASIPAMERERIGGEDRYDTNFKVLLHFGLSDSSEKVYFATGMKYPDALTGGAAASLTGESIVLVHPTREYDSLKKSLLYLNNQGINDYRILGGSEAIPLEKAWNLDQILFE